MYFFLKGYLGAFAPLLPLFFVKVAGLSSVEVGVLTAVSPMTAFICAPLWGALCDRTGWHHRVMLTCMPVAALLRALLVLPFVHRSFPLLMCCVVLSQSFDCAVGPIVDNGTLEMLEGETLLFGQQRLWGAVGFGSAALISGVLVVHTPLGFGAMFLVYGAFMAGSWLVATRFGAAATAGYHRAALAATAATGFTPRPQSARGAGDVAKRDGDGAVRAQAPPVGAELELAAAPALSPSASVPSAASTPACSATPAEGLVRARSTTPPADAAFSPLSTPSPPPPPSPSPSPTPRPPVVRSVLAVLAQPMVAAFFVVVFVAGCATGAIETFLYVYVGDLGGDTQLMGVARFITCVSELPLFFYARPIVRRLGVHGVLVLALLTYVVRLSWYTLIRAPASVLPSEVLHGVTYALMWSACTAHAHALSPPGLGATMQGLLSGVHFGLGTSAGAVLGGVLYGGLGGAGLYRVMAVAVGVVTAAFVGVLAVGRATKRAQAGEAAGPVGAATDSEVEPEARAGEAASAEVSV